MFHIYQGVYTPHTTQQPHRFNAHALSLINQGGKYTVLPQIESIVRKVFTNSPPILQKMRLTQKEITIYALTQDHKEEVYTILKDKSGWIASRPSCQGITSVLELSDDVIQVLEKVRHVWEKQANTAISPDMGCSSQESCASQTAEKALELPEPGAQLLIPHSDQNTGAFSADQKQEELPTQPLFDKAVLPRDEHLLEKVKSSDLNSIQEELQKKAKDTDTQLEEGFSQKIDPLGAEAEREKHASLNPKEETSFLSKTSNSLLDSAVQFSFTDFSDPISPFLPPKIFDTLSPEGKQKILHTTNTTGLPNQGNDCFFNSAIQFLFHSFLYPVLIDRKNLDLKEKDHEQFFSFFENLAVQYRLGQPNQKNEWYSSKQMRNLLGFDLHGQHDAIECIRRILGFYNVKDVLMNTITCQTVDLNQKKAIEGERVEDYSEVDESGMIGIFSQEIALQLHLPTLPLSFQEMIDRLFTVEEHGNWKFAFKDQVYQVEKHSKQMLDVESPKETLFFQVMRFEDQKIKTQLPIDIEQFTRDNTVYELDAFIMYHGNSMHGGHYTAWCNTSEGWIHFDDKKKSSPMSKEQALAAARNSYFLSFKKSNSS